MLYIAYGSNMSEKRMRERCPNAKFITKGCVKDVVLSFHYYANLEPAHDYYTPIVLWDVPESEVDALDRAEGFPKHYKKIELIISETYPPMSLEEAIALVGKENVETNSYYSPNGIIGTAYVMTDWKKNEWEKHNQQTPIEYVEHIITGYKEQGFDGQYLQDLWYALYRGENPPESRS